MPLPLDDQICFTLYATSMAITRAYKPMLDRMGITYPQYLILSVLGEADEGLSVGAIAQRLSLESSTVTPPLKRLRDAGLLSKDRSAADERQVEARLTDKGWAVLEECSCLNEALLARSGMSPDELGVMNRKLQGLKAAMEAG